MNKLMCRFVATTKKKKKTDPNLDMACPAGIPCNYNFHQYSLDGKISAESFSFLPEIFFVKIALKKLHILWPR